MFFDSWYTAVNGIIMVINFIRKWTICEYPTAEDMIKILHVLLCR